MICKLAAINEVEQGKWYEFTLQLADEIVSVMLFKEKERFIAYKNACPHQARRMDYATGKFLIAENGHIICPAHGAEFKPNTGLCINGPCLGQSLEPVHIQTNEESIFAIIK